MTAHHYRTDYPLNTQRFSNGRQPLTNPRHYRTPRQDTTRVGYPPPAQEARP